MPLANLTDPLWDEIAARCPAGADCAALALCCRAGAAAARRKLRCAGLAPPELQALTAAADAGRLPALTRLVLGAKRIWDLQERISDEVARSLSALTGLTELYAAGAKVQDHVHVVQQLVATLGTLPQLQAAALNMPFCSGAVARALAGLTQLRRLELSCSVTANVLRDADAAALAPLTGLTRLALPLHDLTSAGLGPLLAGMAALEELNISWNAGIRLADPPAVDALTALPRLRSLAALHVEFLAGGPAPLARLTQLEWLEVNSYYWFDGHDTTALGRMPALRGVRLKALPVSAGARILRPLATAAATRLRALDITCIEDQAGWKAILLFTGLTRLRLSEFEAGCPGDAGAATLAGALTGLVDLELLSSDIGAPGAAALVASLSRLTRLDLGWNPLGDAGAAALAGGRLHRLLELHCCRAKIGDAGAAAIAAGLTALTRLDLNDNTIGTAGAAALVGLRSLRSLGLARNPGLAAGALGPELERRVLALDRAHLLPSDL